MIELNTFRDVMACWPTFAQFAREIGITPKHAETMKVRGSIPAAYFPRVVAAANARAIEGVTLEKLHAIAAATRPSPPTSPQEGEGSRASEQESAA